jgi:cytochrome b involved in lipid metabolism
MTLTQEKRVRGPSFASEGEESAPPAFNRVPSVNSDDGNNENPTDHSNDKKDDPKAKVLLVKYKEDTYNIHDFLPHHPGGRSILEKYENKDITRAFDDINHSAFARSKLKTYILTDKSIVIEPVSLKTSNKIDAKFVVKKLFTNEDKNMIHKTLGFLSLCSYAYRYLYVYPTTGGLGFTGTLFDWLTLVLHFFLSFSSLIFHVVEKRIVSNPLIIYQEYRMHAIVFTFRGVAITVFGLLQHLLTETQARIALSLLMIAIHSTVDYITVLYGTPGITTVRNDDNGTIPHVKLFFAFYQVLAMSSHLIVDDMLCDLGWNTLIAIQSSAFLMTLKRKSLIRARTHLFWYTLALVISMIYILQIKGIAFVAAIGGLFYLKVKFNLNKYLMWAAFTIGYYLLMDRLRASGGVGSGIVTGEL